MSRRPLRHVSWLVVLSTLAACVISGLVSPVQAQREARPRIVLSPHTVMVDQAFSIRVRGLRPHALVALSLTLRRGDGLYQSRATFRADMRGGVDLTRLAPVAGDYAGVDPMGLIWFARQVSTTPPTGIAPWTDSVTVSAVVAGREVARANALRRYLRPGDRVQTVRASGLVGTYFQPPGRRRRPAVIVVGGSEGGIAFSEVQAALLASHGYDALALAYFDPTGALGGRLPRELARIPGAGHAFTVPYSPVLPFTGAGLGGTPTVRAAASLDQWRATLRFLDQSLEPRHGRST